MDSFDTANWTRGVSYATAVRHDVLAGFHWGPYGHDSLTG